MHNIKTMITMKYINTLKLVNKISSDDKLKKKNTHKYKIYSIKLHHQQSNSKKSNTNK